MKRAFVVLGPESSGTRLMTTLLIAGGCAGDADHDQRWDKAIPIDAPERIVWRRSLPHGNDHMWPNLDTMKTFLCRRNYAIQFILMSRDWHAMMMSQQQHHTGGSLTLARENIMHAYRYAFEHIGSWPYEVVNYETLINHPVAVEFLFQRLGLEVPDLSGIYNGNLKHYVS